MDRWRVPFGATLESGLAAHDGCSLSVRRRTSEYKKGTTMDKEEKVRAFSDFLRQEGYVPTVDEDGDIRLKIQGRTYYVIFDDKDELFFRVIFPNFWGIESDDERIKVERAALKATAETKVAKVFTVRENTWATVEIFSSSVDNAQKIFSRSVSALQTAVRTFADEMNG